MSEPGWTSGPWRVGESYDYNAHHIVPIIPTGTSWQIAAANASMLKPVPGQPNHVREDRSEIIANAHLIATAPDLYAALENLICHGCDNRIGWEGDRKPCTSCAAARAALAKARGEGEKS